MLSDIGLSLSAVLCALFLGCSKNDSPASSSAPANAPSENRPATPIVAEVHDAVQKGAYDDAAARLLELRAASANFSPRQAADYRRALDEAYTRALAAAEKGDAKAQEAIRLIRAGHPH